MNTASSQTRVSSRVSELERTPLEGGLLCSKCGKVKPEAQYTMANKKARGRGYYCRPCRRIHDALNGENPEVKARQKATREKEPCATKKRESTLKFKQTDKYKAWDKTYRSTLRFKLMRTVRSLRHRIPLTTNPITLARRERQLETTMVELERLRERELHDNP